MTELSKQEKKKLKSLLEYKPKIRAEKIVCMAVLTRIVVAIREQDAESVGDVMRIVEAIRDDYGLVKGNV